jgi:G:T-mismatch repair DNA endonuclease (very short patch repair protein)
VMGCHLFDIKCVYVKSKTNLKDTRMDNSLQSVLQTVIIDFQLKSQSITLVMPSCVYSLVSFTHDCFVEYFMLSLPNI